MTVHVNMDILAYQKKNETNFSIKIYISINNGNKNKYVDEQKKPKLNNNNEQKNKSSISDNKGRDKVSSRTTPWGTQNQ